MGVAPDPSVTVKRKRPLQSGYAFPTINTSAPASSAPSAPASDPYGLAAMLGKPIDLSGARSAARADATADTNSLVNGYRGIQAQIGRDASAQAAETERAGLAGATFEKNLGLGSALETSLKGAALDQAGLAAGYAGDFRSTIEAANANVGKALGALGAAPLPSTADAASNVVYGVGGAIPANAMLAAAPYVKAELDRMPAATAAYGRQQAIGALGAGRERAAQFDPRIAEAEAGRSKLERDYLADYTKTATDARQDAVGNAFKAISVDQKDAAARATAAYHQAVINDRAAGRAQTARDKKADRAATKAYHDSYLAHLAAGDAIDAAHNAALEDAATARQETADFNAATSRINARTSQTNARTSQTRADTAAKRGNTKVVGTDKTGRYAYDVDAGTLTPLGPLGKPAKSTPKASVGLSKANGYLTDTAGQPILRGGQRVPVKGSAVKGLSASSYATAKRQAQKAAEIYYWGDEKKGIAAIDYPVAVKHLMHGFSLTHADAVAMLNDFYAPGEAGRPELGNNFFSGSDFKGFKGYGKGK